MVTDERVQIPHLLLSPSTLYQDAMRYPSSVPGDLWG
jgi:hypothetical protein